MLGSSNYITPIDFLFLYVCKLFLICCQFEFSSNFPCIAGVRNSICPKVQFFKTISKTCAYVRLVLLDNKNIYYGSKFKSNQINILFSSKFRSNQIHIFNDPNCQLFPLLSNMSKRFDLLSYSESFTICHASSSFIYISSILFAC